MHLRPSRRVFEDARYRTPLSIVDPRYDRYFARALVCHDPLAIDAEMDIALDRVKVLHLDIALLGRRRG